MSRKFSYMVKGFADRTTELADQRTAAAEKAKERMELAKIKKDQLEFEYRLKSELERDKADYDLEQLFGKQEGTLQLEQAKANWGQLKDKAKINLQHQWKGILQQQDYIYDSSLQTDRLEVKKQLQADKLSQESIQFVDKLASTERLHANKIEASFDLQNLKFDNEEDILRTEQEFEKYMAQLKGDTDMQIRERMELKNSFEAGILDTEIKSKEDLLKTQQSFEALLQTQKFANSKELAELHNNFVLRSKLVDFSNEKSILKFKNTLEKDVLQFTGKSVDQQKELLAFEADLAANLEAVKAGHKLLKNTSSTSVGGIVNHLQEEYPDASRVDLTVLGRALLAGDWASGARLINSFRSTQRAEENRDTTRLKTEREGIVRDITPEFKTDVDLDSYKVSGTRSTLFVNPKTTDVIDTDLRKAEVEYDNIMATLKGELVARDSSGSSTGVVDVENPGELATATANLVAAKNFFTDVAKGKFTPGSPSYDAYLEEAKKRAEYADETFDKYGINIIDYKYDSIFSREDGKLLRKYGGEDLIESLNDGGATSTQSTSTDTIEVNGKVYKAGDTVKLKDGTTHTITQQDIEASR